MADKITPGQISKIWASAKEENLDKEIVYAIIFRESGKESMRALTKVEANKVIDAISKPKKKNQKRTDKGGNAWTEEQRQKVYRLTEQLGWNNDNNRINGFVKRMFKVERLEWLNEAQCRKLIEILKKMVEREAAEQRKEVNE